MKIPYNKLVRDRIPEIIRSTGQRPVTRVLNQGDYEAALLEKLAEEAREARQAPVEELPAELADVLEVLQAIASAHGLTWDQIVATAAQGRFGIEVNWCPAALRRGRRSRPSGRRRG